jgi:hypothetical protein
MASLIWAFVLRFLSSVLHSLFPFFYSSLSRYFSCPPLKTVLHCSIGSSVCGSVPSQLVGSYENWGQAQFLRLQDHIQNNLRFSCPISNPNPAPYTAGTESYSTHPMSGTVTRHFSSQVTMVVPFLFPPAFKLQRMFLCSKQRAIASYSL